MILFVTDSIRKTPTQKIPPDQTPQSNSTPGEFPPRKFPSGKLPPMFLNIPTHVFFFVTQFSQLNLNSSFSIALLID